MKEFSNYYVETDGLILPTRWIKVEYAWLRKLGEGRWPAEWLWKWSAILHHIPMVDTLDNFDLANVSVSVGAIVCSQSSLSLVLLEKKNASEVICLSSPANTALSLLNTQAQAHCKFRHTHRPLPFFKLCFIFFRLRSHWTLSWLSSCSHIWMSTSVRALIKGFIVLPSLVIVVLTDSHTHTHTHALYTFMECLLLERLPCVCVKTRFPSVSSVRIRGLLSS